MRVKVVNLGNGLHRIDAVPTMFGEANLPVCVTDDIMRDVVRREKATVTAPCSHYVSSCSAPSPRPTLPPHREPDGIDAHIDRPQRHNYGGNPWLAENAFQRDLAKYRKAESAIKACDWPAREPMKGTEGLPQQPFYKSSICPQPVCGVQRGAKTISPCEKDALVGLFVELLEAL